MSAEKSGESPLQRLQRVRADLRMVIEGRRTPYQQALKAQTRDREAHQRREAFVVIPGGRDDAR